MDFELSAEDRAFRDRLRAWLAEHWATDWARERTRFASLDEQMAFLRGWQRRLCEAGFVGLSWPRAYGGGDATIMQQAIFYEEMARARAPELPNVIGLDMVGPALIVHGTEAQKTFHLPAILAAEQIFCQGFSEPNAGSDVAAGQTRAVRDGERFVVSGQKVWTTYAQYAECLLLAHRSRRAQAQGPHDAPGGHARARRDGAPAPADLGRGRVQRDLPRRRARAGGQRGRPRQRRLGGGHHHADVRARAAHHRAPAAPAPRHRRRAGAGAPHGARRRHGRRRPRPAPAAGPGYIDGEALRFSTLRGLTRMLRGGAPGAEGSAAKLFWSESIQRLFELMLELEGPYAQLTRGSARAVDDGYWQLRFLRSRGDTIAAGTSEINRNILAERVLGLPKD